MKKTFINKMKKRLESDKLQMTKKFALDNQIDCDGDESDEIQANLLIYLNNQISSRYKLSLDRINIALNKIKNNEYGSCEECGEEILEKRLEFNPCFATCVVCAEVKEKQLRR